MRLLREIMLHMRNEAIAMDIIKQTKDKYYAMFVNLSYTIEENWM